MMIPGEIEKILREKLPGAEVRVTDLTGTMDHFEAEVAWSGFRGKSLLEQHRRVNQVLAEFLDDGRIHALKMKTRVPEPA